MDSNGEENRANTAYKLLRQIHRHVYTSPILQQAQMCTQDLGRSADPSKKKWLDDALHSRNFAKAVKRLVEPAALMTETCPICHEEFESGIPDNRSHVAVGLKKCEFGHIYGNSCIYQWLIEHYNHTCPLCRGIVIPELPHKAGIDKNWPETLKAYVAEIQTVERKVERQRAHLETLPLPVSSTYDLEEEYFIDRITAAKGSALAMCWQHPDKMLEFQETVRDLIQDLVRDVIDIPGHISREICEERSRNFRDLLDDKAKGARALLKKLDDAAMLYERENRRRTTRT